MLGASSYTYAEATGDEQLANWMWRTRSGFRVLPGFAETGGARQYQDRRNQSVPLRSGVKRNDPHPEEQALIEAAPEITPYIWALKKKGRKVVALALRQLLRLLREYPREAFLAAVSEASRYGLYDLDRLERMILRRVARDYFLIGDKEPEGND